MANLSTLAFSKFQVMANGLMLSTPKLSQHFLSTLSTLTNIYIYIYIYIYIQYIYTETEC